MNVLFLIILYSCFIFFFTIKIKPPPEWSAHSKNLDHDYSFQQVVNQTGDSLLEGCYMIDNSPYMKTSNYEFSSMASQKQNYYFGDSTPSIEEAEDRHWGEVGKSSIRSYAMNNDISLFGDDCHVWNLNKFTSYESMIHYKETHENYHVSFYRSIAVQLRTKIHKNRGFLSLDLNALRDSLRRH